MPGAPPSRSGRTARPWVEGLRFMVDERHHSPVRFKRGTGPKSGWGARLAAGGGSLPRPAAVGRAVRPPPVHLMGIVTYLK